MTERPDLQWNNEEIAGHLKSAMDILTPDVLDRIDLTIPQEAYRERPKTLMLYRRMRTVINVAAACLCVAVLGSGVAAFQNSRIDSFVGIDVNPSIELSVNRNEKVLKAEALNADAVEILDDMNLKNVDLNIAVNAVIGSMVRHGYLEGTENAILVTVSNDDIQKAASLRQTVVGDIEVSLKEHSLEAVVYDQQASVTNAVKAIAEEYGISYGKAYFLQELIDENNLSEEELKLFAGMTMEEISKEIADRSYNVRKSDDSKDPSSSEEMSSKKAETTADQTTQPSSETQESSSLTESSTGQTHASTTPTPAPTQGAQSGTTPPSATEAQEGETVTNSGKAKIDYVDFDDGTLNVVFKNKVKWKNAAISVKDENGESYSAKITDTSSDSCEIEVSGLPGGMDCSFTISGVALKEGGAYGSVKGYFDTPDIAGEESTEAPTAPLETEAPTEAPIQPETPVETVSDPAQEALPVAKSSAKR